MQPEALFLAAPHGGQRFALHHAPAGRARAACVYVHPFAEEMNKSRRMAALQSRALARAGCAVLQLDLLGCGDSSGEFCDASWPAWIDDVHLACRWLAQRHDAPLWLWGLRSGALLAAAAAPALERPSSFVLWQPALSGATLLQQFLRLASAGAWANGEARGAARTARDRLARGETVEVAGYALAPALARGLDQARLEVPADCERVEWLEIGPPNTTLSPAADDALARWRAAGIDARGRCIEGSAFWQTAEIEEAPALLDATVDAVAQRVAA